MSSTPTATRDTSEQRDDAADAARLARVPPSLRAHVFKPGNSGNVNGRRKSPDKAMGLRRMLYRVYLDNEEQAAKVFKARLLSPRYQQECLEMLGRLTRELVPSTDQADGRIAVVVLGGGDAGLHAGMFRQAVQAHSGHTALPASENQADAAQ